MSNPPDKEDSILNKLPLPKMEGYFHPASGKYWYQDAHKKWIETGKDEMLCEISLIGHRRKAHRGEENTPAELELRRIRHENNIVYAGPVAGCMSGVCVSENDGQSHMFLVTTNPKLIEPAKGSWNNIRQLGLRLLGEEQFKCVLGWSKMAMRAMFKGEFKQRQFLVFAGPHGCGKSFWQNQIITPMLGGRMARPLQYMTGQTTFNEDLIQAEHLMLEDDNSKIDAASRREFGAKMKTFSVNNWQRIHGKGKKAYVVNSKHWLTMSVNDEPENLHIIPPLDESIKDKVFLLKCERAFSESWPPVKDSEFEDVIRGELPAFVHYLLEEHEIEESMYDLRFGIVAYQHPELLEGIQGLSQESELDILIDRSFAELCAKGGSTSITSEDLQQKLEEEQVTQYRAKKIMYFPGACGAYLGRLSKRNPRKYVRPKNNHSPRLWNIIWDKPITG